MNQGDHILMTELLAQIKEATSKKEAAEVEMGRWLERMKLAQDAGKADLFEAARERARRCRDDLQDAERWLMDLEVQKSNLKREARRRPIDANQAVIARSQQMLKDLEGTPMDPRDARFERMEKEADASDALAALKAKMGLD